MKVITHYTGIANDTKYQFSVKSESQSLTKALGLDQKKILKLKQSLTKPTPSTTDHLDIKETIQKRKKPEECINDIIDAEILHHYELDNLPLNSSLLTNIAEFSEKITKEEKHFFHTTKIILKEIQETETFSAKDFPDITDTDINSIKDIKLFIDEQVNKYEEKELSALTNAQLRSLQGYALIYLLYRYPDKSILQQKNYIDFMSHWMMVQNARQDLRNFLSSPQVKKEYLRNKLGTRFQIVEFPDLNKALSKVFLDPTETSEIIYRHPIKGWCLYNRVTPDDPQVLEEIFPSTHTETEVKKVLKERRDSIISQLKDKNNSLIKVEEKKSLMEAKKTPLGSESEAPQHSYSPQMTLLSGKNSEGKIVALASLMDVAAIQSLEILVIWQPINSNKIQPIHYFNPDPSSSEGILKTRHLLMVSPYEKIILQTGEPTLNENEKEPNDKILEIYLSVSKERTQIIIKAGNHITYVKGASCQTLLTNLQEIQLAFPTQKDSTIMIRNLLQVQQITMLCGLTTYHTLKVESREPCYQSRFDKKPLPLGLEDCDLLLMSVDQDKKIDVNLFQTFSKPILIKQNQNFLLYGRNETGNWQITADLNAEAFKDLAFPELESKTIHSGEYDFHLVIIKDDQSTDMAKIRKYMIKNTSDSLPFLIQRGNELFIYGQVKYGKWQLSEKLDSRFHLRLDVSEDIDHREEKLSSPLLLTQKGFLMLPMETGAGGDCALHAILGSWDPDSKQIFCKEAAKRREELKEFLLTQTNSPTVQKLIANGIIALVMAGSNAGKYTQSLQKEYQHFCLSDDEKHRENWQKFHHIIIQYPPILDYIQRNHALQNSTSFLHQFHNVLNAEGSTLSARMLSLPDLWTAFQQYNQLQEFDWDSRISEDMRKEYAGFVSQPRTWLLPCELEIIAKAFKVAVLYYPCAGAKPEMLNGDEKTIVAVQFNGQNHYERLDVNRYYRSLPKNQAPREIYKEIASKKMHRFFTTSQTKTLISQEIPAIVYNEIATKKAHFPKFPTILYHVNNNMKQKKLEQWVEQYFYLTVDAILRATHQKEYLPWVKTLLGPQLQKYVNGKAWTNPSNDIAVIRQYEGRILQALIDFIATLKIEDDKRIMQYAQKKWQETLQETQSELKKERKDSQSSTEDDEELSENEFKRRMHIQNLRRTEGIMEGLLEENDFNPLLPKNSEESKEHIQKRRNETLLKAKAEWLNSGAKEREHIFLSLKEKIQDHLFKIIKTDCAKRIKEALEHKADKQFSTHFDNFFMDKENNFIYPHHKKRINLLLRFTHQFLNSSVLDNFYQDWNWKKLVSHIKHEMDTGFRHHHPADSFNDMLARKTAVDNFHQEGYLKKMFRHIEHGMNTNLSHHSEESFIDMLARKEVKKTHNPSLPKPANLCDAYQHDSTAWLQEHLPKNDYLSSCLFFSGDTASSSSASSSSLTTRLMKSLLYTEIDFSPLRHVREPSTGNTLLHVALLRYRQFYVQQDDESLKCLLPIIKELFVRDACFTTLNYQKVTPWHFAQLTDFLGSQQQNERLNADYELLLEGFQNLPIETEVSYIVITGLINFLKASTQQFQSSIKFAAIKEGKIHRLNIVKNTLDEYLKKAHQQNDQVLRSEICKILSQKTFPSGFFSLRRDGDSMLLKIAKQIHRLMKQIAPEGEPIHSIAICREAHIIALENNTIQPQEGVIYLIPNADNFTVDAQWVNNNTWYHAKLQKEHDLCLMSTTTQLELGKLYLKEINGKIAYTVMVSKDKTVTNIPTEIKAPVPFDLNNLALLKDAILKVTSKANHTFHKKTLSSISPIFLARFNIQKMPETSNLDLKPSILYVKKRESNLAYWTLNAEGKTVNGVIEKTKITNTQDILEPFDIDRLSLFLPQILEITSKNDHTLPALITFTKSKNPDIVQQVASLCNCRVTPYYISPPIISFNENLPVLVEPETPAYFPIPLALTYTSTVIKKIDDKDTQIRKLEQSLKEKDKQIQELKQENVNFKGLVEELREKWRIDSENREKEKKEAEALRQKEKIEAEALRQKEKIEAEALRQKEKIEAEALRQKEKIEAEALRQKEKAEADASNIELRQQMQFLMQMVSKLSRSITPTSIPLADPEVKYSSSNLSDPRLPASSEKENLLERLPILTAHRDGIIRQMQDSTQNSKLEKELENTEKEISEIENVLKEEKENKSDSLIKPGGQKRTVMPSRLDFPDVGLFTTPTPGPASASSETPPVALSSSASSSSSMTTSTTSSSSESTTETTSSNSFAGKS